MKQVNTLHHHSTDAEVCRKNGWGVGTKLKGYEGNHYNIARQEYDEERNWTLNCREWEEVKQ